MLGNEDVGSIERLERKRVENSKYIICFKREEKNDWRHTCGNYKTGGHHRWVYRKSKDKKWEII